MSPDSYILQPAVNVAYCCYLPLTPAIPGWNPVWGSWQQATTSDPQHTFLYQQRVHSRWCRHLEREILHPHPLGQTLRRVLGVRKVLELHPIKPRPHPLASGHTHSEGAEKQLPRSVCCAVVPAGSWPCPRTRWSSCAMVRTALLACRWSTVPSA